MHPCGTYFLLPEMVLIVVFVLHLVDRHEMIQKTLSSDSVLASQVRPFKEKKMLSTYCMHVWMFYTNGLQIHT